MSRFGADKLPISDYVTDTRSALDQAIRILQAMIDITADHFGYLDATVKVGAISNKRNCCLRG
jgi:activating signal cointegrator complex subunit 3